MLAHDGRVKILDFELAKLAPESAGIDSTEATVLVAPAAKAERERGSRISLDEAVAIALGESGEAQTEGPASG